VSTPLVQLDGVSKRFGEVLALDQVSIEIQGGEVVAMLGPNGAGKTTAISIMLGTRRPNSGTARLFGLDPRDLRARSRIGVMLQESGVPGMLRVAEMVSLFASYYPSPLRVAESIAIAGLDEKAKSLVKDLSGGQKQRLYLALAICGNPDVLFLDEPTVGMDVEGRRKFLTEISEFAARGRTVILTTHYIEEADQLAKRVIVVDRGHVIADSTPASIKARVAGKRIAFTTTRPISAADLESLPLISSQVADGQVRLLTNEPEDVLRELFRRGVQMHSLEVAGADLEEAFLAITDHKEVPA
jgi:ABC-2 type transport system ATP-binding protein